jgi:hypothetical protein
MRQRCGSSSRVPAALSLNPVPPKKKKKKKKKEGNSV